MSKLSVLLKISLRYFFSVNRKSATTIISLLSGIGISIGTASLIICLSVFNGFQNLIIERYNAIYPDYIIKPLKSKYLNNPDDIILNVKELDNQLVCTKVIEENAYIKYDESEFILKILGVDSIFSR